MKTSLSLLLSFLCLNVHAQNNACWGTPFASEDLHGNEVKTSIENIGSLFFDGYKGTYELPYEADAPDFPAFFACGFWVGGFEQGTDDLKMAAQLYGAGSGSNDFWPGPLNEDGTTIHAQCEDWRKVWSVRQHEIEAHMNDFADNGTIDLSIPSILGWPGKGNSHFSDIYGFELPDTPQGLAPFRDENGNGIYEPMEGEVPALDGIDRIPSQIMWGVFNDEGGGATHGETNGDPLKVEVHLTAWAFHCPDEPVMGKTIFTSHKVINRSEVTLDSVFMGLWADPDMGCFCNDGIGSDAERNTMFFYNRDESDDCCFFGTSSFTEGQPAASITLLNRELDHVMVFQNPAIGFPSCPNFPINAELFYSHLTSGNLTYGGLGCDPANPPTDFAFPDDPNDPSGWSMMNVVGMDFDHMSVMSSGFGQLAPGEFAVIELSYGFHREPGLSHLENVTLMYEEVDIIQSSYDDQFDLISCEPLACISQCVWPGDTNRDDIVNHCDLLPIGLANMETGAVRQPLYYYWAPWDAEPWDVSVSGLNAKHTDCDGNGETNEDDLELVKEHYGMATPEYGPIADEYPVGPELYFEINSSLDPDNMPLSQLTSIRAHLVDVPELYGIALQVEYDARYFQDMYFVGSGDDDLEIISELRQEGFLVTGDYALVRMVEGSVIPGQQLFHLFGQTLEDYNWTLPSNQTTIRIKNIKGIRSDGSEIELGATSLTLTFPEIMVSKVSENDRSGLQVFPNPSSGIFHLNLPGGQIHELWVADVFGKTIEHEQVGSEKFELDLSGHPPGLYFLNVKTGEEMVVRKLVLAK